MEIMKRTSTLISFILVLVLCFVVVPVHSVVGRYNGRTRSQTRLFARRNCDKTNKHRGWKHNGGHTVAAHNNIANKWSIARTRQFDDQRQRILKGNRPETLPQQRRHIINRGPIIRGVSRNSNRIIPKPLHLVAKRPLEARSYHVTNNIYKGVGHLKQSSQSDQAVSVIPARPLVVKSKVPLKQIQTRNPAKQVYISKVIHRKKPVVIAHKAPTPNQPLNVAHLVTVVEKKRHLLSKVGTHRLFKPFSLINNVCKNSGRYKSPYLCFYAAKKCHNTRCTLAGGICDISRPCSYPFCEVTCVKPKCTNVHRMKRIVCPATATPMTSYRCINDQACPKGSVCCHQPTGSECVPQTKFQISF